MLGREIRRVPANWQHPKNQYGQDIPLYDSRYSKVLTDWEEENKQWQNGLSSDYNCGWKPIKEIYKDIPFEEWSGKKPVKEDYMPEWTEEEKTHIQLYETTTEGTPITSVYNSNDLESLCEYASKNCSAFGSNKTTKEQWMEMITNGFVQY